MSVITSVFGNCQPEGNVQCIRSNYRADRKRRKFFGSCENRIVDAPEGMIFRYDLTSELLPYVITRELCKGAFYHIGNVVRKVGDGVQEILQCDLDYIGTYERMEKDAQCIITICNVLRELHILGSVEIRLNHCALFKGILQRCGVPEYMHADIKNILLQPCAHASDWTDLRGVCDVHMLQRYLSNWQKGGKVLLRTLEEDPELMAYPDMQRVFDDLELFLCLCEEKGVPTKVLQA
jgi:histidyl-tRNA synthetase